MDQPQAETVHIKDQLIGEKTPNRGRIRIAVDRPDLLPVENIHNGKIGQITGRIASNKMLPKEGLKKGSLTHNSMLPNIGFQKEG